MLPSASRRWAWLRRRDLHRGQCSIRCRTAFSSFMRGSVADGKCGLFIAGSVADLVRTFMTSAISLGVPVTQCGWTTGLVSIAVSTTKVS